MSVLRSLITLPLVLLAAACSDTMGGGSPADQPPLTLAPHVLRWAGPSAPQFSLIGAPSSPVGASGAGGVVLASGSDVLSLDQYTATFWAVRGQERSLQINYLSSTGDTSSPFLRLTTFDPAYVPGVGDLAPGDSVLITVTVDRHDIKVSLQPTGLLFGDPAQLQVSYGGADGDLNGDGVVDVADASIEGQLLGMWYREGAADPWAEISAAHSLSDKSFTSALPHFCEYAVSW